MTDSRDLLPYSYVLQYKYITIKHKMYTIILRFCYTRNILFCFKFKSSRGGGQKKGVEGRGLDHSVLLYMYFQINLF